MPTAGPLIIFLNQMITKRFHWNYSKTVHYIHFEKNGSQSRDSISEESSIIYNYFPFKFVFSTINMWMNLFLCAILKSVCSVFATLLPFPIDSTSIQDGWGRANANEWIKLTQYALTVVRERHRACANKSHTCSPWTCSSCPGMGQAPARQGTIPLVGWKGSCYRHNDL